MAAATPTAFRRLPLELCHKIHTTPIDTTTTHTSSRSPASATPTAFDLLPLELCHKIFEQACTDGGKMGRSLSAVSRGVRLASRRFRYTHLAVRGVYEAEGLADALEHILATEGREMRGVGQEAREEYPRATHLYIALDAQAVYDDAVFRGDYAPPSPAHAFAASRMMASPPPSPVRARAQQRPWEAQGFKAGAALEEERERAHQIKWASALGTLVRDGTALKEPIETLMAAAIARILRAVAPTLESLTLAISSPKHPITFTAPNAELPVLPALRELEIAYARDANHRLPTRLLEAFPPMEALKSLSLGRYDARCMPHDLLRQIARCAPSAAALQLPAAGVRDGWIGYLEPPPPAHADGDAPDEEVEPKSPGASLYAYPASPLPPTLRRIAIPPLEPPPSALDEQFAMSPTEYEALARKDKGGRIEVVGARAVGGRDGAKGDRGSGGEALEREWVRRVEEGGWWREARLDADTRMDVDA